MATYTLAVCTVVLSLLLCQTVHGGIISSTSSDGEVGVISSDGREIERVFIPMLVRPANSAYCCSTGPYNVTTEHNITRESVESYTKHRRIVTGIRFACPGLFWPNRPTEQSCQYFEMQRSLAYRAVSTPVLKLITQQYYCKIDDLTECCTGFIKYEENCMTPEEYNEIQSLIDNYQQG